MSLPDYPLAPNPLNFPNTSRADFLPGSTVNARCSNCQQVFSVPGNFDLHRGVSKKDDQNFCKDPAKVGLVLSAKGLWITNQEWRAT